MPKRNEVTWRAWHWSSTSFWTIMTNTTLIIKRSGNIDFTSFRTVVTFSTFITWFFKSITTTVIARATVQTFMYRSSSGGIAKCSWWTSDGAYYSFFAITAYIKK
jgi:hypothetical protein